MFHSSTDATGLELSCNNFDYNSELLKQPTFAIHSYILWHVEIEVIYVNLTNVTNCSCNIHNHE